MTRLNATSAKSDLGEILDRVSKAGERIIVHRGGKDVAVLVPVEDLKLLRAAEDRIDNEAADNALRESPRIPWEKLKKELGLR